MIIFAHVGDVKFTAMAVCCCHIKPKSQEIPSLLGGANTTVSAEYAFLLAMVLYPGSYLILLTKLTI